MPREAIPLASSLLWGYFLLGFIQIHLYLAVFQAASEAVVSSFTYSPSCLPQAARHSIPAITRNNTCQSLFACVRNSDIFPISLWLHLISAYLRKI